MGKETSNPYHSCKCGHGRGDHYDNIPECTKCDCNDFDLVDGADPNDMSML